MTLSSEIQADTTNCLDFIPAETFSTKILFIIPSNSLFDITTLVYEKHIQ